LWVAQQLEKDKRHVTEAVFMRSSTSNALGPLNSKVPGFRVDDATYDGLRKLAAAVQMTVPEFIRRLCEIRVHGQERIAMIEQQRIADVLGMSQE
jgi:hypothetical protein